MSIYDRRIKVADRMGSIGISHEQIADVFRRQAQLAPGTPINILFGASGSMDREMFVAFTATGGGKSVSGRVIFQILETSTRAWSGPAVLLDARVELA